MDNNIIKNEGKKRNNNKRIDNINNGGFILVVSILLSFVCGAIAAYLIVSNYSVEKVVKNITTSELVETSISTSVDKVYGSTVIIVAYKDGKQISTGTGFVYKKEKDKAYIMTNNHVIDKADKAEIEFNDKSERITAEIVGGEVYSDIAVLTIDANKVSSVVEIGDSSKINLGDTIFTVGSPMGLTYKGTVTKGILSGKDRMVEVSLSGSTNDYYMNVLQLDAAVNPGNSGGALVNEYGQVVGINSSKIASEDYEGMGFAVPSSTVKEIVDALIENGKVLNRPVLGIEFTSAMNNQVYSILVRANDLPTGAIVIASISNGSDLLNTEAQEGDMIIAVNGKNLDSYDVLMEIIENGKVGDTLTLTIARVDGNYKVSTFDVTVKLVDETTVTQKQAEEEPTIPFPFPFE